MSEFCELHPSNLSQFSPNNSKKAKQVKSTKKESPKKEKNIPNLPPLTQRMKELFKEIEKLSIQFKRQNEEEVKRIKKNKAKVIITTTKKSPHQPKSNVVKSQGVVEIFRPKQVAFIFKNLRGNPRLRVYWPTQPLQLATNLGGT